MNRRDKPPPRPRRPRLPTVEEAALWRESTRQDRKLKVPEEIGGDEPFMLDEQPGMEAVMTPESLRGFLPKPARSKPVAGPLAMGNFAGIDRATAERFRKGKMPLATLDLHGFVREEAYEALQNFIESQWARGRRSLLIITGKGRKTSEGSEGGILRQAVPQWLSLSPLREKILAYQPAPLARGGEGAIMVLLKRKRVE